MQICDAMKFLRIAAVPVIAIIIGVPACVSAQVQANPPAAPAAPPVQLQTYTASDQSASVGVPAGWKVYGAAQTNIELTGPQGEVVNLGEGIIAHNGTFQLGQTGPDGSNMSMPYSAKLTDKLTMVFQQRAALNGNPAPQIKFLYARASSIATGRVPMRRVCYRRFRDRQRRVMPWAYSARSPKTASNFSRTF